MITEKYVKTSISLAPHLMKKVDDYASELGISRSNAMAVLVKQAFDYQEQIKTVSDFTKSMPKLMEELKEVGGKLEKNAKSK